MPGDRIPMEIIHTSDLHLRAINTKACRFFEAIIDLALEKRVTLVIIAGDFFDYNAVDDSLVSFAVQQLKRAPCQVFILPGNHDYLFPGSAYEREHLWQGADNVKVFRRPEGETFNLPGLSVWGKPITDEDGIRPLAGIPQHNRDGRWHIAVAHGYYVDTDPPFHPEYHITQDEILAAQQDYIALGHVPAFRCVCDERAWAYYSGEPLISGSVNVVALGEQGRVEITRHFL